MEKGKAPPLEGLIKDIVKGLNGLGRPTEEDMAEAWKGACGLAASKHSRPTSLKKSTLIVNVDGSSWLYELTVKKKAILKKLADNMGAKNIKDIRFRIGEVR